MSVLGFPSRDCSKFKVDISAFDAPAFSKAEPRIEKDEKDFRMGVISVLDECFDKGIFFFLRQEAYPMVSLFSEGILGTTSSLPLSTAVLNIRDNIASLRLIVPLLFPLVSRVLT